MCALQGCADPSSAFGLHVGTPGGQVPEDPPKIKVVVRKRPISRKVGHKGMRLCAHLPCVLLPANTRVHPNYIVPCRRRRKETRTS
jgi:hypothetical protein